MRSLIRSTDIAFAMSTISIGISDLPEMQQVKRILAGVVEGYRTQGRVARADKGRRVTVKGARLILDPSLSRQRKEQLLGFQS